MTKEEAKTLTLSDTRSTYDVTGGDIVAIKIRSMVKREELGAANPGKIALVALSFFDEDGVCLDHIQHLPVSKQYGSFFYVQNGIDKWKIETRRIVAPENASRLEVQFVPWNSRIPVYLAEEPVVKVFPNDRPAIAGQRYEFDIADGQETVLVNMLCSVLGFLGGESEPSKCALATVTFLDANGGRLAPCGDLPVSEKVGPYFYISGGSGAATATSARLRVPPGARRLKIGLEMWNVREPVLLVAAPQVFFGKLDGVLEYDFPITQGGRLALAISTAIMTDEESPDPKVYGKAALMAVSFYDRNDNALIPYDDMPISEALGSYTYLHGTGINEPGQTLSIIRIPRKAVRMRAVLKKWNRRLSTLISAPPTVEFLEQEEQAFFVKREMEDAIKGIDSSTHLVVFYSANSPLMQKAEIQLRVNHMVRTFADFGCRVVYFPAPIVRSMQDVRYSKSITQLSRDYLSAFLEMACAHRLSNNIFICSAVTDMQALAAIDLVKCHGWPVVYEVRDDMEDLNRVGLCKWYHPTLETYAVHHCDFFSAVAQRLADKMRAFGAGGKPMRVIPNGIDRDFLDKTAHLRSMASFAARDQYRIAGYVGNLTPIWFDWATVIGVAERRPEWTFQLVGFGAPPEYALLSKNVQVLGTRARAELPEIMSHWKVGLIPFKASRLTRSIDPLKLWEYLASGLRVVSAPMGSVDKAPLTGVYAKPEDFEPVLERSMEAVTTRNDLAVLERRLAHSVWEERAKETLDLMGVSV